MNPERERRARLDRTDHSREVERRRRDDSPSREAIDNALEAIETHDIPGTPPVGALKVLQRAVGGTPIEVGDRKVRDFRIQDGDPRHGAKRSDDHVGRYEVEYAEGCDECGHPTLLYKYNAYHHISGGDSIVCPDCEHVHHSEDWG